MRRCPTCWSLLTVFIAVVPGTTGQLAAQGLTADESLQRMTAAAGFEIQVVASEPLVRQPVAMEFDNRGRLWVMQYLQYPNPAGLNRVSVDRYSRTTYDRIPEPPPHGPRGADRITILADTDHDGRMDSGRDFVDGLNLATGLAFGHGGVFVLNVPYLLFYPDRNLDDVPDADPEVLLTGFGMEDAHSVANSLMFGPDGWLYGCQGSTVTANIRGIEFQQGVWRYHPVTKEFELFCEGGGNSWGLDFDRRGRLFYSTNYGGYVLVHGVQGGYYVKSFGKHGALHNPHAYGYFEHAPHQGFHGGHVTVGGIVYQGDLFPDSFRGKYIAGDLLGHGVYWHHFHPNGSTVTTSHGGELLVSGDPWFAPTDVTMGPDGAVYVSDWHDARTAHPDPDADWDRSNGRIYRISPAGSETSPPVQDLTQLDPLELVAMLQHDSQWFVRRARQVLTERHHHQAIAPDERNALVLQMQQAVGQAADETEALEALWTLNALAAFDESLAAQLLSSPHPAVRSWTVRLLADRGTLRWDHHGPFGQRSRPQPVAGEPHVLSEEMAHRLDEFAEQEPDVEVLQQLACSAARFPAHQALPMINANINRDVFVDDPYLPLLWWWAVEKHSVSGREEVLKRFVRPTLWKSRLGRDVLLTRLIRRYAAERTPEGLDSVVRLLKAAPDETARSLLWPHVLTGWKEQPTDDRTTEWLTHAQQHEFHGILTTAWRNSPKDLTLLQLCLLLQDTSAIRAAITEAYDQQADTQRRQSLLTMLGPLASSDLIEPTFELLTPDQPAALQAAALQVLARFDDPQVTGRLLTISRSKESAGLASQVRDTLLTRASSARAWLTAVDRGEIPATDATLEQVRRVVLLGEPELDALVAKHWGRLTGGTREEKLAEVRRLNNDLRAAAGDSSAGQLLFRKHCAACHQLFGEGSKVGPDLTTANRQDRDFLLISLVDPSSVIRREFVSVVIETTDGRVLTGLPVERTDATITIADSKGEKQTVSTTEIEQLQDSPVSLMPDNLYRQLNPQELRDLFAWLQRPQ